jgi:hypothetical protein
MVCAYLMATEGLSVSEAIASVREKRKVICPNQGFYEQLMLWEEMGCVLNEQHPKYRLPLKQPDLRSQPTFHASLDSTGVCCSIQDIASRSGLS